VLGVSPDVVAKGVPLLHGRLAVRGCSRNGAIGRRRLCARRCGLDGGAGQHARQHLAEGGGGARGVTGCDAGHCGSGDGRARREPGARNE
jgi:hypothetical protein